MNGIERERPGEGVAGLMAAAALFASLLELVYRPLRIAPAAILIALVAAGMSARHARLAALALGVGAVCFVAGMTIAILTHNPVF